ncbi:type II toxin-antitoxin system VapB family antitoxin [Sphingomonas sp. RS2018]
MASLYIKDEETAALAAEVARRLGTTKTEAVRTALREKKATFAPERGKQDMVAWLKDYQRRNPLPPFDGFVADKAFFDRLAGDEDVEDCPRP